MARRRWDKPLPKSKLTQIYDAIGCHQKTVKTENCTGENANSGDSYSIYVWDAYGKADPSPTVA